MVFVLAACERPLAVQQDLLTNGYQLRGFVRDRIGNPVREAKVRLYYVLESKDQGLGTPYRYTVPVPGDTMTVVVLDRTGSIVKTLSHAFETPGPMQATWDGKDSSNTTAASGVYQVEYRGAGGPKYSYAVVVTGGIVAKTNEAGEFVLTNASLPIGFYPIPEQWNGGSYVNYTITEQVRIVVETPAGIVRVDVVLTKDRIKDVLVTF